MFPWNTQLMTKLPGQPTYKSARDMRVQNNGKTIYSLDEFLAEF